MKLHEIAPVSSSRVTGATKEIATLNGAPNSNNIKDGRAFENKTYSCNVGWGWGNSLSDCHVEVIMRLHFNYCPWIELFNHSGC